MTQQIRRRLFYLSIIVFVFSSMGVLALAFGFSYDFENNQLIKTGSISLRANLHSQVSINGQPAGETTFLSHSFSERGLLPGEYLVQVHQESFRPWKKRVVVQEGLVSDFAKILLIKEDLTSENWLNSRSLPWEAGIWKADPIGEQVLVHNGKTATVIRISEKEADTFQTISPYFLNETTLLAGQKLYAINPADGQSTLNSYDLQTKETVLIAEEVYSFGVTKRGVVFISKINQHPYLRRFADEGLEKLPALTKEDAQQSLEKILEGDRTFYLLLGNKLFVSAEGASWKLIASGVQTMSTSPDQYLLAWITDHEVWTMGLKDNYYQPARLAGEKELLTRWSRHLENLFWHGDSGHLFLQTAGEVFLVEVDVRGGFNDVLLLDHLFSGDFVFYSPTLNQFFRWKAGQLLKITIE